MSHTQSDATTAALTERLDMLTRIVEKQAEGMERLQQEFFREERESDYSTIPEDRIEKLAPIPASFVQLPTRYGLQDEAKWLYELQRDIRAKKISTEQLDLRIYSRQRYLLIKDSWDDATAERFVNYLKAKSVYSVEQIDEFEAKAKQKGMKRKAVSQRQENFRRRPRTDKH